MVKKVANLIPFKKKENIAKAIRLKDYEREMNCTPIILWVIFKGVSCLKIVMTANFTRIE